MRCDAIQSVTFPAALSVAGVVGVYTAANLPHNEIVGLGEEVLASGLVEYHGQPVALVLARSRQAAEEAAGLVAADYEPLPGAVLSVESAIESESFFPLDFERQTVEVGDVEAAFACKETSVIERCGWVDSTVIRLRQCLPACLPVCFPCQASQMRRPVAFLHGKTNERRRSERRGCAVRRFQLFAGGGFDSNERVGPVCRTWGPPSEPWQGCSGCPAARSTCSAPERGVPTEGRPRANSTRPAQRP